MKEKTIYFNHIKDAAEEVIDFAADGSRDRKTYLAIIRNLEVIGEAANRIPKEVQRNHPDIKWREIIGMRHMLIHGYDAIKDDIVWDVAKHDLPKLVEQISAILKQEQGGE